MIAFLLIFFKAHLCTKCGNILSPLLEKPPEAIAAVSANEQRQWQCLICKSSRDIHEVLIPYVFRYLVAELAAMNIKVTLDVK